MARIERDLSAKDEHKEENRDEEKEELQSLPSDLSSGDELVDDAELSVAEKRQKLQKAKQAMQLDPAMMNELLLICSNLGTIHVVVGEQEEEGGVEAAKKTIFRRGEDCEEWVHDLQRAIRRDHARFKLVAKTLGRWKILQKKLIPLLINHQNDWSLVFSILKVLVMLTMKPVKDSENIAQQYNYLRGYKYAFLQDGVIQLLMTILIEPLDREGKNRKAQDYLNMELVLTLFRNLLAIPNEDPKLVTSSSSYLTHLQEQLISVFYHENVYEMLILFAQDIESAENREWNLLILEMFDLTLQTTHPQNLVQSLHISDSTVAKKNNPNSLLNQLSREKDSLKYNPLNSDLNNLYCKNKRHSNFGGMLLIKNPNSGRNTVLTNMSKTGDSRIPQAKRKLKSKRRTRTAEAAANDTNGISISKTNTVISGDYMTCIGWICDNLLSKCYLQLTNSLKTEFRRGANKLLPSDRIQYFHLVWFLMSYFRLKQSKGKKQSNPKHLEDKINPKTILPTLDMFSFNFVLQSIESYADLKLFSSMVITVKLLAEMFTNLSEMTFSSDIRFQRIALSLQHKIFYERDFLDRLPILMKSWNPQNFANDYVTDVITLTHLVLKLLDKHGSMKVLSKRKNIVQKKKSKKGRKTKDNRKDGNADESGSSSSSEENEEDEEERRAQQLALEIQRREVNFDTKKYFLSLISHETIRLYLSVLSQYFTNSVKVNHYVYSFFYRVKNIKTMESGDSNSTLEPMLFNIRALMLFNIILNDGRVQHRKEFQPLLGFLREVVNDFFILSEKNHALFVEILFRFPFVSRTCASIQRSYKHLHPTFPTKQKPQENSETYTTDNYIRTNANKIVDPAPISVEIEGETEFSINQDFSSSSIPNTDINSSKKKERKKRKPSTTVRARSWSKIEDRYLKKKYFEYSHLPSVYEVLSLEDMFEDRDRTPDQIKRRVKYLKLHRMDHDSSNDENDVDKENTNKNTEQDQLNLGESNTHSMKKRKRIHSKLYQSNSDDEEEDDLDFLYSARNTSDSNAVNSSNNNSTQLRMNKSTPESNLSDGNENDLVMELNTNNKLNDSMEKNAHKVLNKEDSSEVNEIEDQEDETSEKRNQDGKEFCTVGVDSSSKESVETEHDETICEYKESATIRKSNVEEYTEFEPNVVAGKLDSNHEETSSLNYSSDVEMQENPIETNSAVNNSDIAMGNIGKDRDSDMKIIHLEKQSSNEKADVTNCNMQIETINSHIEEETETILYDKENMVGEKQIVEDPAGSVEL